MHLGKLNSTMICNTEISRDNSKVAGENMAIIREEISNSKLQQLLPPVVINASKEDIRPVDLSGFNRTSFLILVGDSGVELNDDRHLQIKLQHSNEENTNFHDCEDKEVIRTSGENRNAMSVKAAELNQAFMVGYIGHKNYVKPVITAVGDLEEQGVLMGIITMLYGTKYKPVSTAE